MPEPQKDRRKKLGIDASLFGDIRIFIIAMIVIVSFFYFYGVVLFNGDSADGKHDYSGLEKVTSTLGSIVAAVIGYYFGQRQTQNLAEQAKNETRKKEEIKKQAADISTDADAAKAEIEQMRKQLESIKDMLGV